ncbi:MAG: hypothetical protein HY805_10320 [Nitrospirae bacterium]|nr:hypothetical protein [Nitrospirota bacterium]
MKTKLPIIALLVGSLWSVGVTAGNEELVKGWYDPQNDWFVMEWVTLRGEKVSGIYDPPNKVMPVIKAMAAYDSARKDYSYEYEISNLGGKQPLYIPIIEYRTSIYDYAAPSKEWYISANYRKQNEIHWAKTHGEPPGIPVGATERGFSFKSAGPPAILNSAFLGERRVEYYGPSLEDASNEVNDAYEEVLSGLKKQYPEKFKKIVLKTVAPGPVPSDFNPLSFLDYIISMKHEASSLGWITNKGIEMSLDQKLEAARKKLSAGDTKTAKNILNALINEIEAQGCETYEGCLKGKHLTPEAYALLKYNVLYLIERL